MAQALNFLVFEDSFERTEDGLLDFHNGEMELR